MHNHKIF